MNPQMMESTVRTYHYAANTVQLGQTGFYSMVDYLKGSHIYQVDCVSFVILMGIFIAGSIILLDNLSEARGFLSKNLAWRDLSNSVEKTRIRHTR